MVTRSGMQRSDTWCFASNACANPRAVDERYALARRGQCIAFTLQDPRDGSAIVAQFSRRRVRLRVCRCMNDAGSDRGCQQASIDLQLSVSRNKETLASYSVASKDGCARADSANTHIACAKSVT